MTDLLQLDEAAAAARETTTGDQATGQRRVHHQVVIIGGGTGGIAAASRLRRALPAADVAIIEPSDRHYYQPLWTLVGGGEMPKEVTERQEAAFIPDRATWIREAVTEFQPEENAVMTAAGTRVSYDLLVVAAGIQLDWHKVKGLPESLGREGVCSNYSYRHVDKTWEFIRSFPGGRALFTQPPNPIKCAGAPQKIMYLADDYFRKARVRARTQITFASATPNIFAVPYYAPALERVIARKGIETRYKHNLTEIRPQTKEAVFQHVDTGETVLLPYDLIHVTPPQSAPDFIKRSPLANQEGWLEVDPHTLQHPRFERIFGLGDATSLPTSKTGAAIRAQAPVLAKNLVAMLKGQSLPARYNGYASCPLVTGYGRLILAEFDYDKQPQETFPFDQRKERLSMYLLKKHLLPLYYWHALMRGRL
jgi:sulfide:quinone oxidoreductase